MVADLEGQVPHAPFLAGLPGCLRAAGAAAGGQPRSTSVHAQAMWLKTWFGDRAALALALLGHPHDALLVDVLQRVAALTGLPHRGRGRRAHARAFAQAAAGCADRHPPAAARGRRRPGAEPNAEAHLRSRQRLARLYRPEWLAATLVLAGAAPSRWPSCATNTRARSCPPATRPPAGCAQLTEAGVRQRFPGKACRRRCAR
jgi:error-prone DNA polymerase